VVVPDEHAATSADAAAGRTEAFRGRRVAFNSMTLIGGQVLFTAIGLVTTPVALSHIGLLEFGLWTFIISTVGYITVVDPGFGDMITRYGARAHIEGDRALGARLCSLATLAWLGVGLAGLPLVLWLVPVLTSHFRPHLNPGLALVATHFFYWGYAITIAGCVSAILSARLTAIGDQWLVTILDVVTRVIYGGILIGMLVGGYKLTAIVVATSVQLVLTFLVTLVLVVRRTGAPYGNPMRLHGSLVREVIRFGGWLQLGGVLELLTYDTDPFVIGTFVGLRKVGVYGLSQRAARQTTYFAFIAQASILSAVSAAYAAKEGLAAMRRMYARANRLVVLSGCLIGGGLIGLAPVFLAAWLGSYYPYADIATCLAAVALLLGLPRPAAAAVIMAMGRVGLGVRAQAAAFAINLVLTLALVEPMGMYGVMLATVIAKLAATSYLLVRFHRLIEGSARELLFPWLVKLLAAIGAGVAVTRLLLIFVPISATHQRGPAIVALLALGTVYVLVTALVLRATSYFSNDDLSWFQEILPGRLARLFAHPATRWVLGVPA
jgi:O-antigen/teichoic acid export membrane protein